MPKFVFKHPPFSVPGTATTTSRKQNQMPRSSYVSFHYARDHWRVQQVLRMGAIEGQEILPAQNWETVKSKGRAAIEQWIHDQMARKSAVVVLIGKQTAGREWVKYEIKKAWTDRKPLVGVHVHGLKDSDEYVDSIGANPFRQFGFSDSSKTYADFVPVFNPAGSSSTEVYASIKANLDSWVSRAYKRP